jgi:hypothetical protein
MRGCFFCPPRAAYHQLGKSAEAASELQLLLDQGDNLFNYPIKPAALAEIAWACAGQGDSAQAKVAYENFFKLWQDADTDVHLLRLARNGRLTIAQGIEKCRPKAMSAGSRIRPG